MIPKTVIRKFLNRELKDYSAYKSFSEDKLQRLCDKLPVKPPIWYKLRLHQKVCFIAGVETRRFFYLMDTGTGKTLLSTALIRYFKKAGISESALVLVPNKVNCAEWCDEIYKHSPKTTITSLIGSSEEKWRRLEEEDSMIYVTTYSGLLRMLCDLQPSKKKNRNKLKLNIRQVKRLLKRVDSLYMDESTAVGNRNKLPFRMCRQIAKTASAVMALTGTPFGRDPTKIWGQMYLVDKGETLGQTLGLFREALFTKKENYWGGYDYTFPKSNQSLLHRMLANRSIRYEADKADLPAVTRVIKELRLPQEAKAYYDKAMEQLKKARGNILEMQNSFLRLRQISSGFVGYHDDEAGKRASFEFPANPKLDLLLSLVEDITPQYKVIVFHDFVFSGSVISRELRELGIKHARVHGGQKDTAAELDRFKNDDECRLFLVNNAAGAFGLNLQVAKYAIYYESPVPFIIRKQTERRIERQGSHHDVVFLYDLVVRGTADEQILRFHKEGGDLFKAIVDGKASGFF